MRRKKFARTMREQLEYDLSRLNECLAKGAPVELQLRDKRGNVIALPGTTVDLIRQALELARDGKGVLLLADDAEVSPEKAAELLRISRPTLLKKLDQGALPFHYVGTHRRIALADVLAYQRQQKERAQIALRQMRDDADELGIYE
jgi:excisionase family DNA binding protein